MSLVLGIAVFFVVWWIVLFAVLPFGVKTQGEQGEVVPGTPESAPTRFMIWRIVLINTAVAIVVFAVILAIVQFDLFGIGALQGQSPV